MNYSKAYVKATRSNVQPDLGEGQLAGQLLQEYETLRLLAAHNCRLNKEVLQMQRWMLTAMTDTSEQYLFHQPGRKVTRIGEAFLLHRCKPITDYQVHWNQSHDGTCYSAFPVTSTSFQGIQFLELGRRNIGRHANKISCDGKDNDTYIADKDNNIWHKHKNTFRKIT